MVYNGMELGSFFEIPWNSPCYQVLRGINPILQMIFSFSQLYFVFMNARVRVCPLHLKRMLGWIWLENKGAQILIQELKQMEVKRKKILSPWRTIMIQTKDLATLGFRFLAASQ